jgi:hypothetical protein
MKPKPAQSTGAGIAYVSPAISKLWQDGLISRSMCDHLQAVAWDLARAGTDFKVVVEEREGCKPQVSFVLGGEPSSPSPRPSPGAWTGR